MSKNNSDTKVRILAVERLFRKNRCLTIAQIQDKLMNEYYLQCERKTLYDDIAVLTRFMDIKTNRIGKTCYYLYNKFE